MKQLPCCQKLDYPARPPVCIPEIDRRAGVLLCPEGSPLPDFPDGVTDGRGKNPAADFSHGRDKTGVVESPEFPVPGQSVSPGNIVVVHANLFRHHGIGSAYARCLSGTTFPVREAQLVHREGYDILLFHQNEDPKSHLISSSFKIIFKDYDSRLSGKCA